MNQYIEQGPMCGSDHTAILFSVSRSPIILPTEERYVYNKAKWKEFKASLRNYQAPNLEHVTEKQLDTTVDEAFAFLQQAAKANIPTSKTKTVINVPPKSENTTKLDLCLQNVEHQITSTATNTEQLSELKQLRRELNQRLKISRDQDYTEYYQNLAKDLDTAYGKPEFWEKVDKLKGNVTHSFTSIDYNNVRLTDPQAVVDAFKSTWQPVFTSNPLPDDLSNEERREMLRVQNWCTSEEGKKAYRPHSHTDTTRLKTPTREQMRQEPATYLLQAPILLEDLKPFISRLKNKKSTRSIGHIK